MQIKYLRDHLKNKAGDISDNNLTIDQLQYLVRMGVVEMIDEAPLYSEKEEMEPVREKKENKTGNVPTAKKKKK